jgi:DNA polymerase-3 subunit delta
MNIEKGSGNMIYLLYGTVCYLIEQQLNKIISDSNIDAININKYDLTVDNINKVINDASSMSLFDDKKIIIVNNAICFTSNKKDIDTTSLEQYLNNINENTIMIFIVNNESLDERKKITKLIKKIGNVKEYNSVDKESIVKRLFESYSISNSDIKLLIDRIGDDITLLSNEIEKIKIYKNNDKTITKDDILNLTSKSLETNNFKLIDAIISNDKKLAISLYHERLKLNEEQIAIIIALANQIRIMYQVKQLYMDGYTENNIATKLKIHPYRVKLALQNSKKYDSNILIKYLYELSTLDIQIKSGKMDKTLALELFILSI